MKFALSLALGLMLHGGWGDAPPEVTATVTTREGLLSEDTLQTSADWKAHVTFRGAGIEINLISTEQWRTPEDCLGFLRSVETRTAFAVLLSEMQMEDKDAFLIAECVQLRTPA